MTDKEHECLFCGKPGFDLVSLKNHFDTGDCDVYNETIDLPTKQLPSDRIAAIQEGQIVLVSNIKDKDAVQISKNQLAIQAIIQYLDERDS